MNTTPRHILNPGRTAGEAPTFSGPDITDCITNVVIIRDEARRFEAMVRLSDGQVLIYRALPRRR